MKPHGSVALLCALAVVLAVHMAHAAPIDNIAVQWNALATSLICNSTGLKIFGTGLALPHLHLAQWHALLALHNTGDCTTPDAVVAFASHRVVSHYFPFWKDAATDPLLSRQLAALALSQPQHNLAKRLGAAVALEVMDHTRNLVREYGLDAVKATLTARLHPPTPGLFNFHNNTPAGRQAQVLITGVLATRTFLMPDPVDYIEDHLRDWLRPPHVPSDAWDAEYAALVDIGRLDWHGRTKAMNHTAAMYSCAHSGHCSLEDLTFKVARAVLPPTTPLPATVLLFAKVAVACYDATVLVANLQWGYSFWRPFLAFRQGDPRHAPRPAWTPFSDNPFHPEYPSGTATVISAGIATLQEFFGDEEVGFSLERGVVVPSPLGECAVPVGTDFGVREYASLGAIVAEAQRGRMYAGGHWNVSVVDGARLGAHVAKYVGKNWGRARNPPSGVLPSSIYLNVVAKQPKKAGEFSPLTLEY